MESYLGYPLFLWQGLTNLLSLLMGGLVIAFVTTFYLKRKDESTRVAGVILEKRVEAQHEILNVLENSSQKLEMTQPSAGAIREILLTHGFTLPYDPHIQYADIFSSIEKYRKFFHSFERLFSKHRLWLDTKTRHQMFLMQGYFAAINASMLLFNRIPFPADAQLTKEEMDKLSDQLIFYLGVVLDEEFNKLIMDLDVLMVRSIYKLNLARPKRSFLSRRFTNKEAKKAEAFLLKESIMGQALPKIVILSLGLVEALKGMEFTEEQHFKYYESYSGKPMQE